MKLLLICEMQRIFSTFQMETKWLPTGEHSGQWINLFHAIHILFCLKNYPCLSYFSWHWESSGSNTTWHLRAINFLWFIYNRTYILLL